MHLLYKWGILVVQEINIGKNFVLADYLILYGIFSDLLTLIGRLK